jgi:hypothetical protein
MDYLSTCSSDSRDTIAGEPLNKDNEVVFLVIENSKHSECYDLDELIHWFTSQERLHYWPRHLRNQLVFKMPFSGIIVDYTVYDQIVNVGYKAIYLYKKHEVGIGTQIGVARTHGEIAKIYSGVPISLSQLDDFDNLNKEMRKILPGSSSIRVPRVITIQRARRVPTVVSEESTRGPRVISEESTRVPRMISEESTRVPRVVSEESTRVPRVVSTQREIRQPVSSDDDEVYTLPFVLN